MDHTVTTPLIITQQCTKNRTIVKEKGKKILEKK